MNFQPTPIPVHLLTGPHLYECQVWHRRGASEPLTLRARDKDAARVRAGQILGVAADCVCARYVSSYRK